MVAAQIPRPTASLGVLALAGLLVLLPGHAHAWKWHGEAPMVSAETGPFHAGIVRISIPAAAAFDTLVWYPTQTDERPWQIGPFEIPAGHNAGIASGHFPIVLLSHGGGLTGGSPLILRDLSADLARQGFVVVAPFHGKAAFAVRLGQVRQALDAVLADPRFKSHADPTRLGMLGFSLGGAVTLSLAGATPNVAHLVSYCGAHPSDVMSCGQAPGAASGAPSRQAASAKKAPSTLTFPLKAIVLLDPFAIPFQREELAAVVIPVLLLRPDQSELPGEGNALGLAAALPHPPHYQTVPGGHFIFVDVCAPFLESTTPEACQDTKGVDRANVHIGVKAQIAKFFHNNL